MIQKELAEICAITNILIERLDAFETKTHGTMLCNGAKEFQSILIPTLDAFYKNELLAKSGLINDISNKFIFILNKNVK